MSEIPEYIEARIRRPIPPDSSVIVGSTPVVSFGDASSARVATLGLNPSRSEFLDRNGKELVGPLRRLATHSSVNSSDLANAPLSVISQILNDCNSYFSDNRNPYRRWFDQLNIILKECNSSYYDGSACHLDLVQWATNPTWGQLRPACLRNRLIDDDSRFLLEQISNENIQLLLVNGMGVYRQLTRVIKETLVELNPIIGFGCCDTRLFSGSIFGRTRVVAWSTNLQSSFGVTSQLRAEIAKRVGELAEGSYR